MKRLFDIAVSTIGLLLCSPLLAVVAVSIKLTSKGSVFFRQERVGKNFVIFHILKFRTMEVDAEKMGGQLTKSKDPRITTIGRLLRKTKLDEIPQLINVFKGEMSFVGPRPEVPKYVEMFRKDYEELLQVRPGITDPASLKYRYETEILGASNDPEETYITQILPDKIALAKDYLKSSSFLFDLKLIFKTILRMAA